eukprot:Rhum_TRINITY_DN19241_c0_g1::Rhum_TRINITY_DN19241_c0_g1_i1::g.169514::m.169514
MATGRAGCLDFLPLSERLNPPVSLRQSSSGRAFDPVFEGTGWGRKKIGSGKEEVLKSSLPTGNTSAEDVERRKRTFATSTDTAAVLSCSLPLLAGAGTSSLRDTRFSKGFTRRRVEHPHANAVSEEAAVKAAVAANQRRSVLVSNDTRAGCNPLNGGPPLVGKQADYVPPRIHIKPKDRIESEAGRPGHAAKEGKRREMAAERRHRLQLDGQPESRREWTVKHQMQCYDGYIVAQPDKFAQLPFKYGRKPMPRAPAVNNVVLDV